MHVLHDPHLLHGFHRAGYDEAGIAARISALEKQTDARMEEAFNEPLGGVVNHRALSFRPSPRGRGGDVHAKRSPRKRGKARRQKLRRLQRGRNANNQPELA